MDEISPLKQDHCLKAAEYEYTEKDFNETEFKIFYVCFFPFSFSKVEKGTAMKDESSDYLQLDRLVHCAVG